MRLSRRSVRCSGVPRAAPEPVSSTTRGGCWAGAPLAAGAITFPLSRIPRIDPLAHLADGLILVAFIALAGLIAARRLDRAVAAASPAATM